MATRGHLGGLAWATPQALRVLDAAGCDVILVETVGVGQSEVEVAATADTTVVLLAPGMGDAIQAAKAGILEVGDVYAVNKADRDGADATARELRMMLSHGSEPGARQWRPPIVKTVASRGEGVAELLASLDDHRAWLAESGAGDERRVQRAASEIEALAVAGFVTQVRSVRDTSGGARLAGLAERVAAGSSTPTQQRSSSSTNQSAAPSDGSNAALLRQEPEQ